jgi:hypothetical protein
MFAEVAEGSPTSHKHARYRLCGRPERTPTHIALVGIAKCLLPLTHKRAPITPWGCQRRWSCDYHLATCITKVLFLHILQGLWVVKSNAPPLPPPHPHPPPPSREQGGQARPAPRPGLPEELRRAWTTRVFLRHSNGRSAPRPTRAPPVGGRWSSSAPKPTAPTSQRLTPPSKHTGPGRLVSNMGYRDSDHTNTKRAHSGLKMRFGQAAATCAKASRQPVEGRI